jgi:undecaprenyl-diphosphatase
VHLLATSTTTAHLLPWWKAAILGVVEGLTEYLPISSTGHLLVAARLLDLPSKQGTAALEAVNTYVVAIQFGAILAVVGLFWRRFRQMVRGLFGQDDDGRHLLTVLVIAFLPSAIVGVALDKTIERVLFGPWPVVLAWIVGGAAILLLQRMQLIPSGTHEPPKRRRRRSDSPISITYRQALIIGLAQCLSLWPGTSRSMVTILAALVLGVSMSAAVEFSFLLGFATLTAATLYKLAKNGHTLVQQFGLAGPLVGAVFALGGAIVSIKWLVTYLRRHDLSIFAWYRFGVAALTIGLLAGGAI